MSVFNDLVNIWKGSDLLSEAWEESHEMILLSNNIFVKAIDGLRSGEKTKSLDDLHSNWPEGGNAIPKPAVVQIHGPTLNKLINLKS